MYCKYRLCIGSNKLRIQWNISESRAVMADQLARVNYSILHCDSAQVAYQRLLGVAMSDRECLQCAHLYLWHRTKLPSIKAAPGIALEPMHEHG